MRRVADFLGGLQRRAGVQFYRAAELAQQWAAAHTAREPYPHAPAPQI
ncbi:hypothetical protein [Bordetella sp. 2513F-2]